MSELHDIAKAAREASYVLASLSSEIKNKALANVAACLRTSSEEIFAANKIDLEEGKTFDIDTVLLLSDGDKVSVGTPYVKDAKVTAVVENTFKDDKVIVYKYKSKKDYHRTIGHRQQYTNIRIKDIAAAL